MKLNLIYYKNILDVAVESFIHMHESTFTRCGCKYVMSKQMSKSSMRRDLEKCIASCIRNIMLPASKTSDKLIVIGSCYPRDNLLMSYRESSYFPKKLDMLIRQKPSLKWLMRENDIEVGIECLNDVLVSVFNDMMSSSKFLKKMLGEEYTNVVAVSHSKLDCYMMFKVIKWAYGKSNCCNVWKSNDEINSKSCLVALNDLIHKYVQKKSELNKSKELKMCANEVKDFLARKLNVEV